MPKPVYCDIHAAIRSGKIKVDQKSPIEYKFWKYVNKDGPIPKHRPELGPCWIWEGCVTAGRGTLSITGTGKKQYAHRCAWELCNGPIPEGLLACHKCDNVMCVNPNHLFLGTHKDNSQDMVKKGRSAVGRRNGAHTHPENMPRGDANGSRLHPERLPRGGDCPWALFTNKQVRYLRNRYLNRTRKYNDPINSIAALAREFNVLPVTMGDILRGRYYKNA